MAQPPKQTAIIPHGVDERFRHSPRTQKAISDYSRQRPFRLLYVSIVNLYKHQWHVAQAVRQLRAVGVPVTIDFVGPAYPPALRRLLQVIAAHDPQGEYMRYLGPLPHEGLHQCYQQADAFIFASSCENLPIILLEAMASGLPIACSNRGPMPEILGEAGVYFDPEQPDEISEVMSHLLENLTLREKSAVLAYTKAQNYTWQRCANETFHFISRSCRSDL
jgi:glycosyltransferase involved in cell wall biosynthesis